MRTEMPVVSDSEILDGYKFHHNGAVYTAYEIPGDGGFACGHDEQERDCDMRFVWTTLNCWVFVNAELAEHEQPQKE
jgi:hypothetical protein